MSRTIDVIHAFKRSEENFESYYCRVDLYFVANDVVDAKKVVSFLTLVGPKVYGLARNLLSPKDPASRSYDEIKDTLKAHYKPKAIVIDERYKFYSQLQKFCESVADYIAMLKALTHTCDFDTMLTNMLRNRFVTGLANETTQQLLLAEADLTFNRAVVMAMAHEAALRDVQAMGGGTIHNIRSQSNSSRQQTYNSKGHQSNGKSKMKQQCPTSEHPKPTDSKPNTPCTVCGNIHWKKDCPFKNAECQLCKTKGHINPLPSRDVYTRFCPNCFFQSVTSQLTKNRPFKPRGKRLYSSFLLMPEGVWE